MYFCLNGKYDEKSHHIKELTMKCYDCGILLNEMNKTAEHIPAKNLFSTYPEEFKQNLLTVPACESCNNRFSKIDQEIRDAIGITNENDERKLLLTKKAISSIFRNENWRERITGLNDQNKFSVLFNYCDLEKLHIKNFKGLFYNKYGAPIGDDFMIKVIAEGDENDYELQRIKNEFSNYAHLDTSWKIIGHDSIFKYKLKAMIPDQLGKYSDLGEVEKANGFICLMEYHKILKPLVLVTRKSILNVNFVSEP